MRLSNHFNFYITLVGILTIAYALVIFSYPASFFNDDSLFLSNGIIKFSVVDFSPHFPAYVSLVIVGKFINFFLQDAKLSLFILTSTCSVLIPLVLFLYIRELKNEKLAFVVFILSLSSPYLMNLSLSMMSDSVGLFFFFLGLYFLELKKEKTTGIILAISFFARPSYVVLFLVGIIFLWIYKREHFKTILSSFLLTSSLLLLYIFLTNGMLFVDEGLRFVEGHFTLWGTGKNSSTSWFSQIFRYENFLFLLLLYFKYDKKFLLLYLLFIFYFLWIVLAQNSDSLRHLIPLVMLATIFLANLVQKYKSIVLIIMFFNIYIIQTYNEKYSPIEQIIVDLKDTNKLILSNRSVEILRDKLDTKVFDAYYKDSLNYYSLHVENCLVSTQKQRYKVTKIYNPRFIGEDVFYLYCTNLGSVRNFVSDR